MTNLQKEIAELSSMELSGQMPATPIEKSQAAQFLGRLGGKASVKSRFKKKTKKEISEMMRRVRKSSKKETTSSQDLVDCLNLSVLEQQS